MAYFIQIKQGNLVLEESDFIVNASNTRLLLGSGVSMAFKRHCGIDMQKEMDAALQSLDKEITQGDVVATSSVNAINFKYALHVAIMNYNKGVRGADKNPNLDTIQKSLENIEQFLYWYAENRSKTMKLTLPLLGCGVGKLDKIDVIELYRNFFSKEIPFECHIVIYAYNHEDYKLINKKFHTL